ncbi:MAG: protein kinase [Phycisphaerales bacterium]
MLAHVTATDHADDAAATAAVRAVAERAALLGSLERVGHYRIERVLSRGGFGVVYLAEQEAPVRRPVAIKVLDPGRATPAALRHFELEKETLASLQHPHIASLLDAGSTDWGQTYIVMELIAVRRGDEFRPAPAITEYCDERRMDIPARLELFREVCHAVQYAHARGVIHRDLKPSNILIAEVEGRAVPKVIDFGIAKLSGSVSPAATDMTHAGSPLGSLAYMSPEQARGDRGITVHTDVYGLGVVLFELLSGMLPIDVAGRSYPEVITEIISGERPSATRRLSEASNNEGDEAAGRGPAAIATRRGLSVQQLRSVLASELEWIPRKAMDAVPAQRYSTVSGLAEDVRRYLSNEPLEAGPPSRWYRASKFVARHRGLVVAASAVALAVTGGLIVALYGLRQANDARLEAEAQADIASRGNLFLSDAVRQIGYQEGSSLKAVDVALSNLEQTAASPRALASAFTIATQLRYDANDWPGAAAYARRAYETLRKAHGPDYPETLVAEATVSLLEGSTAPASTALSVIYEKLRSHPSRAAKPTLEVASMLSTALLNEGHPEEVVVLVDGLDLSNQEGASLGEVRSLLSASRALALSRLKRPAEAEREYRVALAELLHQIGPNSPITLQVSVELAEHLRHQERYAESVDAIDQTIALMTRTAGPACPEFPHAVTQRFLSHSASGRAAGPDDLALAQWAAEVSVINGTSHPKIAAEAHHWLAIMLIANHAEAAEISEVLRRNVQYLRACGPLSGNEQAVRSAINGLRQSGDGQTADALERELATPGK